MNLVLAGGDGGADGLAIAPAPQTAIKPAADQLAVLQLDQVPHRALAGGDGGAHGLAIAPAPQAAINPAADQLAVLQRDQAQHRALAGGDCGAHGLSVAPAPQTAIKPAADQLTVLQLNQAQHLALAGVDGGGGGVKALNGLGQGVVELKCQACLLPIQGTLRIQGTVGCRQAIHGALEIITLEQGFGGGGEGKAKVLLCHAGLFLGDPGLLLGVTPLNGFCAFGLLRLSAGRDCLGFLFIGQPALLIGFLGLLIGLFLLRCGLLPGLHGSISFDLSQLGIDYGFLLANFGFSLAQIGRLLLR